MHIVTLYNNCLANKRKHFLQYLNSIVFVCLDPAFVENVCLIVYSSFSRSFKSTDANSTFQQYFHVARKLSELTSAR